MKYFLELKRIFKKKINLFYLFSSFFIIFWILRILPHLDILWNSLNLESMTFYRWFDDLWERTIIIMRNSLFYQNFLAFVLPFFISLNIILFKELYQKQKFILKSKGFFSSISGMFFGLFGVGCATCSGLLLAPLISFFGISWLFELLPYKGEELGIFGLILIIFSNIYLLKKITDNVVCKK